MGELAQRLGQAEATQAPVVQVSSWLPPAHRVSPSRQAPVSEHVARPFTSMQPCPAGQSKASRNGVPLPVGTEQNSMRVGVAHRPAVRTSPQGPPSVGPWMGPSGRFRATGTQLTPRGPTEQEVQASTCFQVPARHCSQAEPSAAQVLEPSEEAGQLSPMATVATAPPPPVSDPFAQAKARLATHPSQRSFLIRPPLAPHRSAQGAIWRAAPGLATALRPGRRYALGEQRPEALRGHGNSSLAGPSAFEGPLPEGRDVLASFEP